jgi:hypothetical protein
MNLKDIVEISYIAQTIWESSGCPSEEDSTILKQATSQYKLLSTFEENKSVSGSGFAWSNYTVEDLGKMIKRWFPSKKNKLQ